MRLAILRHGPTEWNAQGRIQGRTDIPLSAEGRVRMAALGPPEGFAGARAYASPLSRARETAALLGFAYPILDERLAEHHWGDWEGMTRGEILARDGANVFERHGKGIEFRPPGGESTREFLARVESFLRDVARNEYDAIAVAHRGVMRSAYALATGWTMDTAMPTALDTDAALVLSLAPGRAPGIDRLNLPLTPRTARPA